MANPFEKRATEYLADTEAFLAVVTPEPLLTFFQPFAKRGTLYDRLVIVTGTPGSGKTTLARLFEFSTVNALLRNRATSMYRALTDALTQTGALADLSPRYLGARIPMESEYREFWEFPYTEGTRQLLTTALIEARAMIRWLRQLSDAGVPLGAVELIPRGGAEASLEQIGGRQGDAALARARAVEAAIYRVVRSLVPPPVEALRNTLDAAYHPFDVLEMIRFPLNGEILELVPLIMLDDAHSLHPEQFERVQRWLTQREMRVARWVLTRLDALAPSEVLSEHGEPDVQKLRVTTEIRMQLSDRQRSRTAFRKMARDMSSRYLQQMDAFSRRQLTNLTDVLTSDLPPFPAGKMIELVRRVDVVQRRVGASDKQRAEFEQQVEAYFTSSTTNEKSAELVLAAVGIALERYGKRVPQLTFDVFDEAEPQLNRPINIDASVIDGARIHLLHSSNTPYYYGFDTLCDASTENAEQFLQLSSQLVEQVETRLIRGRPPGVSPLDQHRIITKRAQEIVRAWDFPHHQDVRKLTDAIGESCLVRSLEGNASLGGGANAWGVPQVQFDELAVRDRRTARVLQFAVAYNALVLKPQHSTKNRSWCLLELGGPVAVTHGLTLRRGGFLERELKDVTNAIGDSLDA